MSVDIGFFVKNEINRIFKKNYNVYMHLFYIYLLLRDRDSLEQKKCFGAKNPNSTIYIIRPRTNGIEGLMALFNHAMIKVDYAYRKGYVPVIDMKNYHTQYDEGTNENIWDWYFSQPDLITLEDAYQSKNVILSGFRTDRYKIEDVRLFSDKSALNADFCQKSYSLIKKHIRIADEWNSIADEEAKKLGIEECIGVYMRGTDYLALTPVGEPVQPSVDMVIKKTEEFVEKYNAPIYIVTEDERLYKSIRNAFPEVKTVSHDKRIDNYEGRNFLSKHNSLTLDKRSLGGNYLVKLLLLSRCKYFVGGITQGSIAALCFNGNRFEDKFVFDLGYYK